MRALEENVVEIDDKGELRKAQRRYVQEIGGIVGFHEDRRGGCDYALEDSKTVGRKHKSRDRESYTKDLLIISGFTMSCCPVSSPTVDIPIMTSSAPNFLKIVNLTVSLMINIRTNVTRRIHVAVVMADDLFVAVTDVARTTKEVETSHMASKEISANNSALEGNEMNKENFS